MFQSWRWKLREAKVAYQHGRLDDAKRLLQEGNLREFRLARELSPRIAAKLLERARSRIGRGETSAGWRDLKMVTSLDGTDDRARELKAALMTSGLDEVTDSLNAFQPDQALARLARLEERSPLTRQARSLRQVAQCMHEAKRLMRLGKFSVAEACLASAEWIAPKLEVLGKQRTVCKLNMEASRRHYLQLHGAVQSEAWTAVLEAAETLLAIAPENVAALTARRRAWEAVGMNVQNGERPENRPGQPPAEDGVIRRGKVRRASTTSSPPPVDVVDTVANAAPGGRFLLWVDAVGGYFVCLGDRVTIGQPAPGSEVDLPLLGDLSRRHAVIQRDREGYVIEPLHTVRIDGRTVTDPTPLRDGDLIELGGSVRLRFRRPHALSGTARLDLVSHHKTHPATDAVLLMADSCIMGPAPHCHVVCRDWSRDVILFRQGDALSARTAGELVIDGREPAANGPVTFGSHVEGDDCSFSLEPLDPTP
ncbi:MAG: FHA domain-containing protein [Pirellulales bacterium]